MKNPNTFTHHLPIEKSGVCLMALMQHHLADILNKEKGNDKFIHLYNTGAYWVAFEQSACQLSRVYPQCAFSLFRVKDGPDYIVMTSIRQEDLSSCFRKHIVCKNEQGYKVLMASPLPAGEFHQWHIQAVRNTL